MYVWNHYGDVLVVLAVVGSTTVVVVVVVVGLVVPGTQSIVDVVFAITLVL